MTETSAAVATLDPKLLLRTRYVIREDRLDPPPPGLRPHLTVDEALAGAAEAGLRPSTTGSTAIARFGLYYGNATATTPSDLAGALVTGKPAWIVLVKNVALPDMGPAVPSGSPPRPIMYGNGLTFVDDASGHSFWGVELGGDIPRLN